MVVAVGGVVVYIIHAQQPARAVSDSATDTSSAADAAASTPAAPAAADAAATTATNAPDAVDESHIFLTCSETNASNGNTDTFELEITPAAWFMNGQKQNSWVNGHLESGQVSMSTTAIEISEIVPGIVIKYTIDRQNGDIIRTMISTSQDQPSNSAPAWHGHCDKHGPPKTSF
jgi:pyruvate/2-oxoglutarate dehydrogenase complex dihydrolipoamide acyltransferase (E2) component